MCNLISIIIFFNLSFGYLNSNSYYIKYEYFQSLEIDENTRRSYPPEILQQIKEASSVSYDFSLYTNKSESVIKLLPRVINTQSELAMEIEPDLKFSYKNLKENYIVNLIEFNKKYYVKDTLQDLKWENTNEQKNVLGYKTRKFLYEDENQIIEIWCANDIDIPNGPLIYSGNENLILESTISNKKGAKLSYHFIATEIKNSIEFDFKKEKPKKIISRQKFDKFMSDFKKKEREINVGVDKN